MGSEIIINQLTQYTSGSWNDISFIKEDAEILHISLDFWNTIALPNPQFKIKRAEYIQKYIPCDLTINQINASFQKIGKEYNSFIESGFQSIPPIDLYLKVFKDLHLSEISNIDVIIDKLNFIFLEFPPIIFPAFYSFLEEIKNSGKTLSITSNTAFISGDVIKKYLLNVGLNSYFKIFLFSDECGIGKPSQEIFNELILNAQKLNQNISKNSIIHIGDNYNADYSGALLSGIRSFHLNEINYLKNDRFATHEITCIDRLPISAEEYSMFKFGDISIANKYADELFNYFILNHFQFLSKNNSNIIIYSSPYYKIPTSSFYLASIFYEKLISYFKGIQNTFITVNWGKINRLHTYTEDYGSLNANQRYHLIKNDTYAFDSIPNKSDRLIFIDDISITGTHQRVIEKILTEHNLDNESLFLYYCKLNNSDIDPTFENVLNYHYVNSLDGILNIINSNNFKITTRAVKFILSISILDLKYLFNTLKELRNIDLLYELHDYAILNDYNKIPKYEINILTIKEYLQNQNS